MGTIVRVVVGLVGLFNIVLGLGFLLDPAQAGLRFFLTSLGTQGMATMRADFTAFFVTGGVFALVAAWRACRTCSGIQRATSAGFRGGELDPGTRPG